MKTGGILLRVSTNKQAEDDKTSYRVQLDQCLAYAAAHDIDVPNDKEHIWDEVGSRGNFYTREGLQKALRAIEEERIQVLIVWRWDRLNDQWGNFKRVLETCQRHHALPVSATEPEIDLSTPEGQAIMHLIVAFKIAPERVTFAQRVNENRKLLLKQGRPWAGNRPRYGYRWIQDPSRMVKRYEVQVYLKERLEPDPETAPVVRQVYQWSDEGMTLQWIARALSGFEGGGRWRRLTPREYAHMAGANMRGLWRTTAVCEILKFSGYMGRWPALRSKREPRDDGTERHKKTFLDEDQWEWVVPSPAPALVTREQWERVQVRLRHNKLYSTKAHDENGNPIRKIEADQALLYGGMARCGVIHEDGQICGDRVVPRPRGQRYTRPDGTRPIQYRCDSSRRMYKTCKGVYIEAELLDKAVTLALATTLAHPDNIARLARRAQQEALAKAGSLKVTTPIDEYHALQKRLAQEEDRQQQLILLSGDPELDEPSRHGYKLAVMRQTAEVQRLEEDCERARKAAVRYQRVEEVVADLEHYLKQWRFQAELMALGGYTRNMLRSCLEALGARVIVHPHSDDPSQPIATLQLHLTRLDFGAKTDDEQGVVNVSVLPASSRTPQRPTQQFLEGFGLEPETEDENCF
jgi:DNA invertase Pin-like site-specific DNA recombinase